MSNFINERLAICNSCEYKENDDCILCGCFIPIKVTLEEESCPLTPPKWGKQSQVVISKPEIESAPAQVPTLESTAPQQRAVCLPCQQRNR